MRKVEGERRGCLICRESSGGFSSEEHPIGESIGNTEIVLPNGVVCDRCNHGTLSMLDEELAEFLPIKMRRTQLGIVTKAGKIPVTRFQGGEFRMSGPAELRFEHNSPEQFRVVGREGPWVHFKMSAKGGKPITPAYCAMLSRAVLKAAFECAWLDLGEEMLEPRWDHVRRAILGDDRAGYLCMLRAGDPDDTSITVSHWPVRREDDGADMLLAGVTVYGVILFTDSLRSALPSAPSDDVALTVTFP